MDFHSIYAADGRMLFCDPTSPSLGETVARAVAQHVDLTGAQLHDALLDGVNLSHAKLRNAILRNASVVGCDMRYCDLQHADLSGANLSFSNATGSYLNDSDMADARVDRTVLRECDLTNAVITSVDFDSAVTVNANFRGTKTRQLARV
jgi:uncharacterized protein YjbI with pentapeptide repeats